MHPRHLGGLRWRVLFALPIAALTRGNKLAAVLNLNGAVLHPPYTFASVRCRQGTRGLEHNRAGVELRVSTVLITSIPVFTIVIRYNLLRGNICSNKMAIFWSAIFPWLIVIPFQTNDGLVTILNWASLIVTSPSNLLVPFVLFIVSKRHVASVVLDTNVSPRIPRVSDVAAPSTPVRLTPAPEQAATPGENIPVVIITDSTDVDSDNSEDAPLIQKVWRSGGIHFGRDPDGRHEPCLVAIQASLLRAENSERGQRLLNKYKWDGPPCAAARHRQSGSRSSSRPSLSLSRAHSITHSSDTGMNEFLLISPTPPKSQSQSVRAVLSAHGLRPSVSAGLESPDATTPSAPSTPDTHYRSTGSDPPRNADVRLSMSMPTVCAEEPVPVFKAFPCLSPTSPIRSTRISAIAFLLAAALVLTAIVYDIVEGARVEVAESF